MVEAVVAGFRAGCRFTTLVHKINECDMNTGHGALVKGSEQPLVHRVDTSAPLRYGATVAKRAATKEVGW